MLIIFISMINYCMLAACIVYVKVENVFFKY